MLPSAMFDVDPSDIQKLNDTDLRELVGRLCEVALAALGLSPAAVAWGGSQAAKDGGLDVRVNLPSDIEIAGFIPHIVTGFQIKKPDMARAAITNEMQPAGSIRPVVARLVSSSGTYAVVSVTGWTAETGLRSRRTAITGGGAQARLAQLRLHDPRACQNVCDIPEGDGKAFVGRVRRWRSPLA